jgi:hypothetical protein
VRLVVFVAATVTIIWAVSVLLAILLREYEVLAFTTPLAGAVVGYTTGIRLGRSGRVDV